MSLKTWKEEFYPIPAERLKRATALEAIKHSLRKWEGLLRKNRRKHGVVLDYNAIVDETGQVFEPGYSNCSLCAKFFDGGTRECPSCPIQKVGGVQACCLDYGDTSPWSKWEDNNEPAPMVRLLRKVKRAYEEGEVE